MWRRTRLVVVPDHVPVIELIGSLGGFDVVVVDVDNTLVPDGAPPPTLTAALKEAREASLRCGIDRLIVVSNGNRNRAVAGDDVIWQVNKPWTRPARLGIASHDRVAVVGDRVIPDGLLARRLGAEFYFTSMFHPDRAVCSGPVRYLGKMAWRSLFDVVPLD